VLFGDAVHPTHAVRPVGCWGPKDLPVAVSQSSGRKDAIEAVCRSPAIELHPFASPWWTKAGDHRGRWGWPRAAGLTSNVDPCGESHCVAGCTERLAVLLLAVKRAFRY
jgi:hypothetical protein